MGKHSKKVICYFYGYKHQPLMISALKKALIVVKFENPKL